jgi:hypothetical protein
MSFPQLTLDEVRALRAIGTNGLASRDLSRRKTMHALRGLALAGLIEPRGDLDDPAAVRLRERGREWLSTYLGPAAS